MKVRTSLRSLKNKPGAQVIRRHGKVYVINKRNPAEQGPSGVTRSSRAAATSTECMACCDEATKPRSHEATVRGVRLQRDAGDGVGRGPAQLPGPAAR